MSTAVSNPFDIVAYQPEAIDLPATDWGTTKNEIVARLNLLLEYKALGVKVETEVPTTKGWIECHAIDREDVSPSAGINIKTGVYSDRGGNGLTCGFLDFALKFGHHGRWIDVVKHYAEKAGVKLGKVSFGSKGKVLEHIYEYYDAKGELRYGVHRYRLANGDKDFRQYPWANGDWKKTQSIRDGERVPVMEGVEPLPYRLPDLIDTPLSTPVYVVEGEKDADRLVSLGFTATTNHQGAKSTDATWPHFLQYFPGRHVVVIPDNDPAGKQHANKVAAYLKPVAAKIQYLELPNLPFKGDISDWFDRGGEVADFLTLTDKAPEWSEESQPDELDPEADAHVGHLIRFISDQKWIWPEWIPSGALTLLVAEPGVGKTRFMFDLHRRIVKGLPWPDGAEMTLPSSTRFLWVPADSQHQEFKDLYADFGIPEDQIFLNTKVGEIFGGTMLETPDQIADFANRVARVAPRVVVIDTIGNTSSHSHYSNEDAMKRYKPLAEIARAQNIAIICVIHTNAKGRAMGRRAEGQVRVVIQLAEPDPDHNPNRLRLWVSKTFSATKPVLGVTRGTYGNEYDENPPEIESDDDTPRKKSGGVGGAKRGPTPVAVVKGGEWLKTRLGILGGSARVSVLRNQWEADGHNTGNMYRARDLNGIIEEERDGKKFWVLQSEEPATTTDAPF